MKRIFFRVLAMLIIITLPTKTLANSTPIITNELASYNTRTIDSDCPIAILHQNLTFDFATNLNEGTVTATYTMQNPTSQDESITMLFPFPSSICNYLNNENLVQITVDGKPTPSKVYFANKISEYVHPNRISFTNILTHLEETPKFVDTDYINHVVAVPSQVDKVEVEVYFESDNIEVTDDIQHFTLYANQDAPPSFITSKQPSNIEIICYNVDGEILDVEYEIQQFVVSHKEILLAEASNYIYNELDNHTQNELLKIISQQNSIFENIIHDRVVALQYNVDFAPNQTLELSITYSINIGYNSENTHNIYNIVYFLEPAKLWTNFGTLNIDIKVHGQNSHLVGSNIDFIKLDNGDYNYNGEGIPVDVLTFGMYPSEDDILYSISGDIPKNVQEGDTIAYWIIGVIIVVVVIAVFASQKPDDKTTTTDQD
ncbi:MAG: hypothetical protein ATN35_13015 [Epulopiscium sp. Nele67-Bin004]|nr:MAG: hypothetical protein ATN35_13015 [Epulopiscium sp. Nele67-Bin004]